MPRKRRVEIAPDAAARVLFLHDRVCCVCRTRGKPVQIHHVDEDPSNSAPSNLAVLCFDCHHETQIRGGFDRKLDAEQIVLYRDDWVRSVARERSIEELRNIEKAAAGGTNVAAATSIAEIYRERKEYQLLAIHYNVVGNKELRDKYIELALKKKPSDGDIAFFRALQGRPELIPKEVVDRLLAAHEQHGDHEQKARFLCSLGRYPEATTAYLTGIIDSLQEGNFFSAAYYLGEVVEAELREHLLEAALRESSKRGDLWWQVRALQELGWESELRELLLKNKAKIRRSGTLYLKLELARAEGDTEEHLRLQKKLAETESWE